jgi:hypothetical protein
VRIMYENFSSLSIFTLGPACHKKVQQLKKLMSDYSVDLLAGCETRTDWRFVLSKKDRFCNLFGNGQPTRGVCASNTNDGGINGTNGVGPALRPLAVSPPLLLRSDLMPLALVVGGPMGNFPPLFFFPPQLTKSNSEKKQKNGTDHGLTTAPFPPNPISTNRSRPPPSSKNSIPFTKISPILATSRHNAHRGRCRDVARIGVSVAP